MRTYLLIPSLLMIAFSLFMEILIAMGGSEYRDIECERERNLCEGSAISRWLARFFYFLSDHRPMIGIVGFIGLVIAILNK